MTIRGLSVSVMVTDRAKAARWYAKTLGFRILDEEPEHWTAVGDRSGKFQLHLCEYGEYVGEPGKRPPGRRSVTPAFFSRPTSHSGRPAPD